MRDRLVKLLKQAEKQQSLNAVCGDIDSLIDSPKGAEFIADYLLANGGIVLPCKFLQRVYVIPTIENRLSDVTEMKCIGFTLSHDAYCVNLMNENNKLYQPAFGRFGKTVFLTKEEAERASLKGGDPK